MRVGKLPKYKIESNPEVSTPAGLRIAMLNWVLIEYKLKRGCLCDVEKIAQKKNIEFLDLDSPIDNSTSSLVTQVEVGV